MKMATEKRNVLTLRRNNNKSGKGQKKAKEKIIFFSKFSWLKLNSLKVKFSI